MDELLAYRGRFPILRDCIYLINHSLAAMPAAAEDRLLEYARMWRERGIRAWAEGWWELPVTVGGRLGRIMGAPPGTIVMHQNVTIAEEIVLSCFRQPGARNRIVYEEANFPSVRYLYQAQPDLEVVAVEDDRAIVEAIDERTLLVPISHVLFKNAEIQDVEPIVRRAHEAGAHVVLDCYQSAGVVPFDVTALGVDFATGGSVKWLCGGPGAGWLYIRPDLAERLEPTFVGWQGHARPFAFEPELEYAHGARRFLTGTPNVPALYAATAGYDVIEEIGVDRIRVRSLALTSLLIDLLDDAGLAFAGPASAAQFIDRNATGVHIAANAKGEALFTYRAHGVLRHVLVWGAINARFPATGTQQVRFKLDYSGGWHSRHTSSFAGSCGRYDGPALPDLVAACTAPDGSYWAAQSWQRPLPDLGFAPWTPELAQHWLEVSHWTGDVAKLETGTNWVYGGRFQSLFGRYTYLGQPVFGFHTTNYGAPTDGFGRLIYLDTFNSVYGAGWRRENSFVPHNPTGAFCYGFYPFDPTKGGYIHPAGWTAKL